MVEQEQKYNRQISGTELVDRTLNKAEKGVYAFFGYKLIEKFLDRKLGKTALLLTTIGVASTLCGTCIKNEYDLKKLQIGAQTTVATNLVDKGWTPGPGYNIKAVTDTLDKRISQVNEQIQQVNLSVKDSYQGLSGQVNGLDSKVTGIQTTTRQTSKDVQSTYGLVNSTKNAYNNLMTFLFSASPKDSSNQQQTMSDSAANYSATK